MVGAGLVPARLKLQDDVIEACPARLKLQDDVVDGLPPPV